MATPTRLDGAANRTIRQGLVKKRRRRWMRRLKSYVRLAMAVFVAFGVYRLWTSPFWLWDGQMSITGNRLVTRAEISRRLSIPGRTPLYRLNPQYIASQLESVPAISRVAVRRWLFPARLELTILERQALVEVQTPEGTSRRWLDQEGVVFSAPAKLMSPRFPIKVWTPLKPGERLPEEIQTHLFELLNAWPKDQGGRLDLRNPRDVYASIGPWPVRLGGVDAIALKFGMFSHLQPLALKYQERLKYINLRFPNSPTFVLKSGDEITVPAKTTAPKDGPSASPAAAPSTPPASPAPPARPSPKASTR